MYIGKQRTYSNICKPNLASEITKYISTKRSVNQYRVWRIDDEASIIKCMCALMQRIYVLVRTTTYCGFNMIAHSLLLLTHFLPPIIASYKPNERAHYKYTEAASESTHLNHIKLKVNYFSLCVCHMYICGVLLFYVYVLCCVNMNMKATHIQCS